MMYCPNCGERLLESEISPHKTHSNRTCNCGECITCKQRIYHQKYYKKHREAILARKAEKRFKDIDEEKLNTYWEKVRDAV